MLHHLNVPKKFNRNTTEIAALGTESTGQQLIELAMDETGIATLENVDVLDVGCGVRFTQTLINRAIPIGSYTGIEVHRPLVEFLKETVEAKDGRFRFVHCDIRNAAYNPNGEVSLLQLDQLPVDGNYDQIWLFSVFTHLNTEDAEAMLRLLRRQVRPSGTLFFSAFIDPELEGFEDHIPETPLYNAYFGLNTMNKLIEQAGWTIESFHKRDDSQLLIADYFVCSPSE